MAAFWECKWGTWLICAQSQWIRRYQSALLLLGYSHHLRAKSCIFSLIQTQQSVHLESSRGLWSRIACWSHTPRSCLVQSGALLHSSSLPPFWFLSVWVVLLFGVLLVLQNEAPSSAEIPSLVWRRKRVVLFSLARATRCAYSSQMLSSLQECLSL